jgi:hypothetical protein
MSDQPGIVPYVVPFAPLRQFFGSRDVPTLERIKEVNKRYLADNDEVYRFLIQNGAPRLGQALDQICAGQVAKPEHPSQYALALELLCMHFGAKQPARATHPIDKQRFIQLVDPVLRAWGLGTVLRAANFVDGVWPISIPRPTGLPTGGTITPDEVEHALFAIRQASMPRVDAATIQLIGDVRAWLEAAGATHGALVCFYY